MAMVFGGLGDSLERVEQRVRHGGAGRRSERPGRELHVVLGQRRDAEGVVHEHLAVALRHAHRREDRAGGVGPHQQVDLVGGDQLLVEGAGEVGLRLVVLDQPFHLAAQQAAARVELLDVDLAHQLVGQGGRRQRPGQRQRAADADRLLRRLRLGLPPGARNTAAAADAARRASDSMRCASFISSFIFVSTVSVLSATNRNGANRRKPAVQQVAQSTCAPERLTRSDHFATSDAPELGQLAGLHRPQLDAPARRAWP